MRISDRELTQLQETGQLTVGGHAGVPLAPILGALDTLGIDPRTVTLWSNDPIVVRTSRSSRGGHWIETSPESGETENPD